MTASKALIFLLVSSLLLHIAVKIDAAARKAPEFKEVYKERISTPLKPYEDHGNQIQVAGFPEMKINKAKLDEDDDDFSDFLHAFSIPFRSIAGFLPFLSNGTIERCQVSWIED